MWKHLLHLIKYLFSKNSYLCCQIWIFIFDTDQAQIYCGIYLESVYCTWEGNLKIYMISFVKKFSLFTIVYPFTMKLFTTKSNKSLLHFSEVLLYRSVHFSLASVDSRSPPIHFLALLPTFPTKGNLFLLYLLAIQQKNSVHAYVSSFCCVNYRLK